MNPLELILLTFREFGIVQERVDAIFKQKLPADLPAAQFKLLNHLIYTTNKAEVVSDIARNSHVTLSAMSQVIKQVKNKGLVNLIPQEHDARRKSVVITKQGRKAHDVALKHLEMDIKGFSDKFSQSDLEDLYRLSRQFRTAFEDHYPL